MVFGKTYSIDSWLLLVVSVVMIAACIVGAIREKRQQQRIDDLERVIRVCGCEVMTNGVGEDE